MLFHIRKTFMCVPKEEGEVCPAGTVATYTAVYADIKYLALLK